MGADDQPKPDIIPRHRPKKPRQVSRNGRRGKGPAAGRLAAARALVKVDAGAHIEDALAKLAPADPRDRGQAWFVALGVLRRRGEVDAALRGPLTQPIGGLDPEVRAALRLGAFEKLFGRAGDHAVVNEAVEVVKALGAGRAKGLVNAVLRRVRPAEELSRADALNHPAWLVARWTDRYGTEAVDQWCQRNAEPAPLCLVSRAEPAIVADTLRQKGLEPEPVRLAGRDLPGAFRLGVREGRVTELPGFSDGLFWVQDPAAVAVADLVAATPGERILDACAAPGGKSFRLLTQGAVVTAVDHRGARLQRLREGLERLALTATLRHHDWSEGPLPDAGDPFDAVLVDAPCTGLGTVRRHPEIRWRRQLTDVLALPAVQLDILSGASAHVRSGGRLVYAVCSPEPEEGRGVIDAFLATNPDFSLDSDLSTAPPAHHEDAHYAARLIRG